MKDQKTFNLLCVIILAVQFAAEAMTGMMVYRLGMLPDVYLGVVVAILVLVWLLVALLMFLPGKKGKKGYGRKIAGCVLALLTAVGCAAIASIADDVSDTMDSITNSGEVNGVTMAVYVTAEDPAQDLADVAQDTFAILSGYESSRTESAIASMETSLGTSLTVVEFASVQEMLDALYGGEVRVIILNSAYVTLLEEEDAYADFSDRTRILHEVLVADDQMSGDSADGNVSGNEGDGSQNPDPNGESNPADGGSSGGQSSVSVSVANGVSDVTKDPFVVYVSGSDTRSYTLTTSRSDVNILMVVNPQTKQILLVNTPRDYYVSNPSGGWSKDKLTHCGVYGIKCSMRALANLYETDVDYYAQINFTGFEILIDAIGGVTVYSSTSFTAGKYPIAAGNNHLNGAQALAFARERYNLAGGDNARGQNQMKVIKAVISKVTSGTTIISNYSSILSSLQGMLSTNLSSQEIGSLVKMQLSDMASWEVFSYAVTGTGGSATTYSMPGVYLYVMYPNQSTVDKASNLIQMVLDGKVITSADISG